MAEQQPQQSTLESTVEAAPVESTDTTAYCLDLYASFGRALDPDDLRFLDNPYRNSLF